MGFRTFAGNYSDVESAGRCFGFESGVVASTSWLDLRVYLMTRKVHNTLVLHRRYVSMEIRQIERLSEYVDMYIVASHRR